MLLKVWSKIEAYRSAEEGATAIEYGLIAAGISLVIAGAVYAFGSQLSDLFSGLGSMLTAP
ncbi:MAG: Flp family type IVb pilin [Alphaproteobacteria bacterium]|nr:Flp family type IVb pilin [Alphaproteobacteria bacterium]